MDELQAQATELKQHWDTAYQAAKGSPNLWQPYLAGISLSVLNEAVETLVAAISRVRAPKGFYPIYQMARNFSALSISGLIQISQQLEAGQYQQLPNFSGSIVTALGAIHTMSVFAPKDPPETSIADMSTQFAQATAVLNTAQQEFGEKLTALQQADDLAADIVNTHNLVKQLESQSSAALSTIEDYRERSEAAQVETARVEKQAQVQAEEVGNLLESSRELDARLHSFAKDLEVLKTKTASQSEVIDSILPRAASAGLAAAFADRGGKLDWTKWTWIAAFIVSLLALALLAVYLTTLKPPAEVNYWAYLLYRISLAGPLIWLGWFSAVQYGNTIRVQEDYAFKEATSKAFQGYRDHLQYLSTISGRDGSNAMSMLAEKTIEILAREPLRIYDRVHHDASPLQKIASLAEGFTPGANKAPHE